MRHMSNSLKVSIFVAITGVSESAAIAYLMAEEWDIYDALASYRADQRPQA